MKTYKAKALKVFFGPEVSAGAVGQEVYVPENLVESLVNSHKIQKPEGWGVEVETESEESAVETAVASQEAVETADTKVETAAKTSTKAKGK